MGDSGNLPTFLRIAERQKHVIIGRDGEQVKLEAPVPSTLIYVQDCKNCECELERKAMKVIVEGCTDCVFNINSTLISGMIEMLNCENVVLNFKENGSAMTLAIDGSKNVKINTIRNDQFEFIYIHHCTDLEVIASSETPTRLPVITDHDPNRQFVIHWEKEADGPKLVCEKVIRDGIYPTTEKALSETIAKEKEFSEKMAIMMVDGIKVTQKPKKSKGTPGTQGKESVKPLNPTEQTTPIPEPTKPPRPAPNIEDEDEKKEFFDSEDKLSSKLDVLAQWIKESKHCIIFTGAGISTSTGIPDFRSGMKTVLETGPGVWELRAKGVASQPKAKKVTAVLKAVPSVAHMAIVKLHDEGLVKFTVSQNVDGLHLRSGIRADQLAELHGNTNLEKCTRCKAKYLRDFRTRSAHGVFEHQTGRTCDNPKCRGPLVDSIINFGENLPEYDLKKSFEEARKSDLCIVLGSSLRVTPASDIPETVADRGKRLVICNLQKTPLNDRCALEIHAQIDDMMLGVMKRLALEVPPFTIKRRVALDVTKKSVGIQGLDIARNTPYSFLRQVQVKLIQSSSNGKNKEMLKVVLSKEPFTVAVPSGVTFSSQNPLKLKIILGFQGHYGEPDVTLIHEIKMCQKTMFFLSYDVAEGVWEVQKSNL